MRPPGYSSQESLHGFLESLAVELPGDVSAIVDDHPLVRGILPGAEEHELFSAIGQVDPAEGPGHADRIAGKEGADDFPGDGNQLDLAGFEADDQRGRRINAHVHFPDLPMILSD